MFFSLVLIHPLKNVPRVNFVKANFFVKMNEELCERLASKYYESEQSADD